MVVKLVKAEEVQKYIRDYGHGAIEDGKATLDPVDDIVAISGILDLMPGVDAVEIVRCKDCSNSHFVVPCKAAKQNPDLLQYVCKKYGNVPQNHFCGYGERRKNNE